MLVGVVHGCGGEEIAPQVAEAEPSAGAESAALGVPVKKAPRECPREVGLYPNQIRARVSTGAADVRACFAGRVLEGHRVKGEITTRFTVGADGKVSKVRIMDSDMRDEQLRECIVQSIGSWCFPQPEDGEPVAVQHKFKVSSQGEGGAGIMVP